MLSELGVDCAALGCADSDGCAAALGCADADAPEVPELPGIDAATSLGVDPWVACVGELPGCGIVVVTVPAGGGLCVGVAWSPERSWDPSLAGATVA